MRLAAQDRRQQVIDIATELFAAKGFNGTTTREIAQKAGVNEAIIFRHFPSKEELYWAVLESKCIGSFYENLEEILGSVSNEEELFRRICEDILVRHNADPGLLRLLLFSALENRDVSGRFLKKYAFEYHLKLADHIRKGIEEGRFRDMDPVLAARAFLGMAVHFLVMQEVYGAREFQTFDMGDVSRSFASIWILGMSAATNPRSAGLNPFTAMAEKKVAEESPAASETVDAR